jgi:hypothetical protein
MQADRQLPRPSGVVIDPVHQRADGRVVEASVRSPLDALNPTPSQAKREQAVLGVALPIVIKPDEAIDRYGCIAASAREGP